MRGLLLWSAVPWFKDFIRRLRGSRFSSRSRLAGDGPYRSAPTRTPERRRRLRSYAIVGVVLAVPIALLLLRSGPDSLRPAVLGDLPATTVGPMGVFPPALADLPVATPLEPLLAADQAEQLTLIEPPVGATRLNRNDPLHLRFNRPMVHGSSVGTELRNPPITLRGTEGGLIRGTARWTSRSRLVFHPEPSAWDGVREAELAIDEDLSSLDGAPLQGANGRVVVFDGTPHLLASGGQRVGAGAALPLFFDNAVQAEALTSDILAYEIGGGARTIPFALHARGWEEARYRIDLRPGRSLEPGAQIGVALAPRWTRWAGSSPAVARYFIQPRPHIEGIGCEATAARYGGCAHTASPGRVIDIGPELRILATEPVRLPSARAVVVRPTLPDLQVVFADASRRVLELRGRWAPGQVYEVRFGPMRTPSGAALDPLGPLAVRSRGHEPQVRSASGHLAFEMEDDGVLRLQGIAIGKGALLRRDVAESDAEAIAAALHPRDFVAAAPDRYIPLLDLMPEARPNQWDRGSYRWAEPKTRRPQIAVMAFRPGEHGQGTVNALFAQRTNLGATVRMVPKGALVWVSRLHDASAIRGARVTLADDEGTVVGEASTDATGAAFIATETNLTEARLALLARHVDDRAVLVLDRGRVVGPAAMDMPAAGAAVSEGQLIGTVFTDRGAYRPGSALHAHVSVRAPHTLRPLSDREVLVRVQSPGAALADLEARVRTNEFGTATASFELPDTMALGHKQVVVAIEEPQEHTEVPRIVELSTASIRVAEFREPSFRVDIGAPDHRVARGPMEVSVDATYLFGAPAADADLSWNIVSEGGAHHHPRWERFGFAPADHHSSGGTRASGRVALDANGEAELRPEPNAPATVRERWVFEAEVRDRSGQSTSAHREVVVHPAELEVGLEQGSAWVPHCDRSDCEPLRADVITVDTEDEAVGGQAVEVVFYREGWHSWWQWSGRSNARDGDGSYQARRQHQREAVHRCTVQSNADHPVRCEHRAARPGTYLIEAIFIDPAGNQAVASRRLYVAGPDEAPDRDPPGSRITVTPDQRRYRVGDTAELAIESPWPIAEVLTSVERDGVIHRSRERIGSGGHVIRVPITEDMVPNAFVAVALLRPRLGPPGPRADLEGPDLRFGMAQLVSRPTRSSLDVALHAPRTTRPGEELTVSVQTAPHAEVALWAVDEGILRLTDYTTPDPTEGFYRHQNAAFAWEDLRRILASRVDPPEHREGGDGSDADPGRALRPREPVPVATPLWAPQLSTDDQGRASATVRLPDRDTEYRILAIAMTPEGAYGHAEGRVTAHRDVVVREALPRFVTEGDHFEAAFFVTNTTDEAKAVSVSLTVGDQSHSHELQLKPGEDRRVAQWTDAPSVGRRALDIAIEATGESGSLHRIARSIPIAPRARWVHRSAFAGIAEQRSASGGPNASVSPTPVSLRFPEGSVGHARMTVATHPFVGASLLSQGLDAWADLEHRAARVIALAAQLALQDEVDLALDIDSLRAEGHRATAALLVLQETEGHFGRYAGAGWATPFEVAQAVHALLVAQEAGFGVPPMALERGLEWLTNTLRRAGFGDAYGIEGEDVEAYALHLLAQGGSPLPEHVDSLYERREHLSYGGRAHLALALPAGDGRRETLIVEAAQIALATERDPTWPEPVSLAPTRVWDLGALVEGASRTEVGHQHAGALATALFARVDSHRPNGWATGTDTIAAAQAFVAYASLFRRTSGGVAKVQLGGDNAQAGGDALRPASATANLARYDFRASQLARASHLTILPQGASPVFFAMESDYAEPVRPEHRSARGRGVALHRIIETAEGRRLTDGDSVPLGATLRVRLFTYTEQGSVDNVRIYDPLGAGFDAVDGQFASSPDQALRTMLGMGPDDEAMDPRGYHAMRTAHAITHRTLEPNAASFYFDSLPGGLQEVTYAVRATTPGRFTLPPTQIEAREEESFEGHSALMELEVQAPGP